MITVTDDVLSAMASSLAELAPECGGAMLGPVGVDQCTRFVFDEWAGAGRPFYQPSRELAGLVKQIEGEEPLELKGIAHSHPGWLASPSAADRQEAGVGLALNPHMPYYLLPVVAQEKSECAASHELPLAAGRVGFYAAYRGVDEVLLRPMDVRAVACATADGAGNACAQAPGDWLRQWEPRLRDELAALCEVIGAQGEYELFASELDGAEVAVGRLILPGIPSEFELLVMFSTGYPIAPPTLMVTGDDGQSEAVVLDWDLHTPPGERLACAIRRAFPQPGPYRRAYGPAPDRPLTTDPQIAALARWPRQYASGDPDAAAEDLQEALFARSTGLLSKALRERQVLLLGAGSGGSYMAEQLVRSGLGGLTLVDFDTVEPSNLCRASYDVSHLGLLKVEALASRLLNINPRVRLSTYASDLLDLGRDELHALVAGSDLVIAASDDVRAERTLNRFAYALGKPALFMGLYAGAQGGEVVITVPERTACYLCATYVRHQLQEGATDVHRDVDYGTGRLVGEVALGVDIHHLDTAGVKLALSLLLPDDGDAVLAQFARGAVERDFTYLTLSTVPDYWFYPSLFENVPGQYAYQSVWITPTRRPECPVCGSPETREDPMQIPLRSPSIGGIITAAASQYPDLSDEPLSDGASSPPERCTPDSL